MVCCYIVGCNSNSNREKTHLFKLPSNATPEVKQKWEQYIPKRKDREWNFQTCKLCYKHFDESFIIKSSKVFLKGKLIAEEARERWTLTPNAFPTIFSNDRLPEYFNRKSGNRKLPRERPVSSVSLRMPDTAKNSSAVNCTISVDLPSLLKIELPIGWSAVKLDGTVKYQKLLEVPKTEIATFQVDRQLCVCPNEIPQLIIRGKLIPGVIQKPILTIEDAVECVNQINSLELCHGVKNYDMFTTYPNAVRCGHILMSSACTVTVKAAHQCNPCQKLRVSLQKAANKILKRKRMATYTEPLKSKLKRLQNQKSKTAKAVKKIRKTVHSLQETLREIRQKFKVMSASRLENVISSQENIPPPFKLALILSAKLQRSKSKYSMRYPADWILQSLLLKINSPKQYRYLRDNKILPLPNPNYLTSYLKGLPCQFGFNDFVFSELEKQYENEPRINRQVTLLFDEMKVREAISFDKTKMKYFGFVDYGDFTVERNGNRGNKSEADHALVFMVRTMNGRMTQPIGAFATRGSAPGNVLSKMILSAILKLEDVKLEVVAVICDGATNNKSAWRFLGIPGDRKSVNNRFTNPVDKSRFVHFMCDFPHIFKCIRNNLHKNQLALFQGECVNWGFYKAVYDVDSNHGDLRIVPKITINHINPGPFQKMVVSYATQVLSKGMADGIRYFRDVEKHPAFKNSEATEKFTRCLNSLFDAGNARLPSEGLTPSSPGLKIIQDFLLGMEKHDEDNYAADVTMLSIKVTLKSMIDIVEYLCNVIGYKYVLTSKLNQDCLEKFFGLLRSFGGDDAHPTITSFAHLYRLLSIYSPTAKMLRGNIRTDEEYSVSVLSYIDTLKHLRKCQKEKEASMKVDIEEALLSKIICSSSECPYNFLDEHNYSTPMPMRCIIYQLCGFLVYKSKSMTACELCISKLTDDNSSHSDFLTVVKDLGKLKYPCTALVNLICDVVEPKILAAIKSNITSSNIVNDVVHSLSEINCFGLGCCEDHARNLAMKMVCYYITIRFYFHEKRRNKEHLKSTIETKRKMKQAKLS